MITYKIGNILESDAEALVNTVNTVGVMGKGIALQFKEAYPENYYLYKKAVENDEVALGKMFITQPGKLVAPKYIINFPTKGHWRYPSNLKWIREGLHDLKKELVDRDIQSVAIPALGCGQGGLEWQHVKSEIEKALSSLNIKIIVFKPGEKVKEILRKQKTKKEANLTAVRAMLLYLLFHYRRMGEFATEFAAEKLSYFLQRLGEKQLKLDFEKGYYGPYSGKVRHVLYVMNGTYIRGYEGKDLKPFEPFMLETERFEEIKNYVQTSLNAQEEERLETVLSLIKGFESPFALELLATVDFIKKRKKKDISISDVMAEAENWSDRKKKLLNKKNIETAATQLEQYF
jgi:O-acetyl-ADP-ribose deacetylase (regulator of RNase III)